jgi:hypothetical protein
MKVLYLCDRRACDECHTECDHTDDIRHARNYTIESGCYIERQQKTLDDSDMGRIAIAECPAELANSNGKKVQLPNIDVRDARPESIS